MLPQVPAGEGADRGGQGQAGGRRRSSAERKRTELCGVAEENAGGTQADFLIFFSYLLYPAERRHIPAFALTQRKLTQHI